MYLNYQKYYKAQIETSPIEKEVLNVISKCCIGKEFTLTHHIQRIFYKDFISTRIIFQIGYQSFGFHASTDKIANMHTSTSTAAMDAKNNLAIL